MTSAAPGYPAYVYARSGDTYLPEATLIANDLGDDDPTPAVAVSAGRIAIGALKHTVALNQQGAVYVFAKQGVAWPQQQKLLAGTPRAGANFGAALAMNAAGMLFVGAPFHTGVFDAEGTVYVHRPPVDLLLQDGFE